MAARPLWGAILNFSKTLYSLQLETSKDFQKNLESLVSKIDSCEDGSIILAPEVALTDFCYDRMDEAGAFADTAIKALEEKSKNRTIALTLITKDGGKYQNTFFALHNGKTVHTQNKHKLFGFGGEHTHFKAGKKSEIKIFEIEGIKCASLICFELRFIDLWKQTRGADIIFVPARWGVLRKSHYESLCHALAIANQCYVIASDSSDAAYAKGSAIISPFGERVIDDDLSVLSVVADSKEIKKMRKYLDVGINEKSKASREPSKRVSS